MSGSVDAKTALDYALRGEKAALEVDPRLSNSEGASFGRVAGGSAIVLSSGFRVVHKGSYQSLSVVPLAEDEGGKKRRGYHWTAKRHLATYAPVIVANLIRALRSPCARRSRSASPPR